MASAHPQQQLRQLSVDLDIFSEIGKGAYGTVYRAKFVGSVCAVKLIHTAPLSQINKTSLAKFEQECKFMNTLRHPNLVQSMGTLTLDYPILVMELMDCDLTSFLQNNQEMGICMEFSLAFDIINGIRYLHYKEIVHRDLSGANILMSGTRAKISDLGMAKLLSAFQSNHQLTPCPGNKVYMPLAALFENPSYSYKIDIYCYGVLLIQIMTKKYPQPILNIKEENGRKILPTEIERRQNHLLEISDDHILKHVAICCINDEEDQRPSAIDIQNKMEEIKTSQHMLAVALPPATSSHTFSPAHILQLIEEHKSLVASKAVDRDHIQQLTERVGQLEIGMKDQKAVMELNHQKAMDEMEMRLRHIVQHLQQEADQKISRTEEMAMQEVLGVREQAKLEVNQAQESARAIIAENGQLFQQKAEDLRAQLDSIRSASFSSISTNLSDTLLSVSRNSFSPELSFDVKSPIPSSLNPSKMHQDCTAVVIQDEMMYLRPARTRRILTYDQSDWSLCPLDSLVDNCALAFVSGSLVTIGGNNKSDIVNTLYRYNGREWVDDLPPMQVARELPLSCTSGKLLIVVGGRCRRMLNVVEIFHEESRQWERACCIPVPLHFASIATYDESLVITGIKDRAANKTYLISCKLTDLTYSANGDKEAITNIWKEKITILPPKSGLSKFSGHLLAVGGLLDSHATGKVYSYIPEQEQDSWREVTSLNNPRYLAFTAVLSDSLYVIGGDTGGNNLTDSIEIGTYQ